MCTDGTNLPAFRGDPLKSQSPHSAVSSKRGDTLILLRISLFFQVDKGFEWSLGQEEQTAHLFQRCLGTTQVFPHRTAWLSQRASLPVERRADVPQTESLVTNLQPLLFLPRFYYNYINTNSFWGGGILKWETEKAFVPSPYSETAGTPYLLIPPISWPWNEGRENSSSLTSGGSKNVSLTYIAATSVQCGVLGRMWTPTFQGGMNFKNGWQVLSWKSGGGVQEKVS